ncbi:MAG: archaeosortase A, partial [Thermoplasmata archaeon]
PFYAYLGYHEYLSYIWDEKNRSLKWITGASFYAGGLYFLIDKIPIISGYIIHAVAVQTVWLINIFGFNYKVGAINYADNPLWYRTNYNEISVPIEGSSATIIQSCTAIQSMLIFIAAIYCVQALKKRKWNAFLAIVPVIYVLNLLRNLSIIYMMDALGWSYDLSHHTIGKAGSFLALIILAFIAFKLLPELLDNIWGIIDLKDRQKKKEEGDKEEGEEEVKEEDKENDGEKEVIEPKEEVEKEVLVEEEQGEVVEEEELREEELGGEVEEENLEENEEPQEEE